MSAPQRPAQVTCAGAAVYAWAQERQERDEPVATRMLDLAGVRHLVGVSPPIALVARAESVWPEITYGYAPDGHLSLLKAWAADIAKLAPVACPDLGAWLGALPPNAASNALPLSIIGALVDGRLVVAGALRLGKPTGAVRADLHVRTPGLVLHTDQGFYVVGKLRDMRARHVYRPPVSGATQ